MPMVRCQLQLRSANSGHSHQLSACMARLFLTGRHDPIITQDRAGHQIEVSRYLTDSNAETETVPYCRLEGTIRFAQSLLCSKVTVLVTGAPDAGLTFCHLCEFPGPDPALPGRGSAASSLAALAPTDREQLLPPSGHPLSKPCLLPVLKAL